MVRKILSSTIAIFLLAASASADGLFTVTKVLDSTMPAPSGGTFDRTNFGGFPRLNGEAIIFGGQSSAGTHGIYLLKDGFPETVVDSDMATPNGTGTYSNLAVVQFSVRDNTIAFVDDRQPHDSLYRWHGGTISHVTSDYNLKEISVEGNQVAFIAQIAGQTKVLLHNGSNITTIADQNTIIPPTGQPFGQNAVFADVTFHNSTVSFYGRQSSQRQGIYQFRDGTLSMLVDTSTEYPTLPPDDQQITSVISPGAISGRGDQLGFLAFAGNRAGAYLGTPDGLTRVVDTSLTLPDRPDRTFQTFGPISVSDTLTAIQTRHRRRGNLLFTLYAWHDGQLLKVIDGAYSMSAQAVDGNTAIIFDDNHGVVYRADRLSPPISIGRLDPAPALTSIQNPEPGFVDRHHDNVSLDRKFLAHAGTRASGAGVRLISSHSEDSWVIAGINVLDPATFVEIDANFTSESPGQGLLTLFWDNEVVAQLDEQTFKGEKFRLLLNETPLQTGFHTLGALLEGNPSQFDLKSVTLGTTLEVALEGDFNGNGRVEQADLDLVLLNWGRGAAPIPEVWTGQDLPFGRIDQDELDRVLLHWGATNAGLAANAGIPEPSSLLLLLASSLALALYRKK